MGISQLRALLERKASLDNLQFIIPYPLLPPRFREISEDRNMILLVDLDLTTHVRWEGERMVEHHPLSKGEVRRLMREVGRNISNYRQDLEVYARFIDSRCEEPFDDKRYEAFRLPKPTPDAEQKGTEPTMTEIIAGISLEPSKATVVGGESPFPEWDY